MRTLLIYDGSLYSRHELGYVASLKLYGIDLLVVALNGMVSKVRFVKETVEVDEKLVEIPIIKIPRGYPLSLINTIIDDISINPHVVITMPRKPYLVAINIAKTWDAPLIARFWSIRAVKLIDNLRHGAYTDILIFLPSLIANYAEAIFSNGVMVTDNPMYNLLRRLHVNASRPLIKLYPPAGFRPAGKLDEDLLSVVENNHPYIMGFTMLNKRGAYLKFEAAPHALLFYRIARRAPWINFVVGGSTREEFIEVFPQLRDRIPRNLIFIGRGFTDDTLKRLYRHSLASINYISNRSISNRLLEVLALGIPVVVNSMALILHPELKGDILIADSVDEYTRHITSLYRNESYYEDVKAKVAETYYSHFSPRINALLTKALVTNISM